MRRVKSLIGLPSRPGTIESLFIAYRLTGHPQYHEWEWNIFESITEHCRVPSGGYSWIKNVNVTLDPHPAGASKESADAEGERRRISRVGVELDDAMETFFMGTVMLNLIRVQRYSYFDGSAAERALEIPLSPLLGQLRMIFDSKLPPILMDRFRDVDCSIFSDAAVVFNTEVCLPYLDMAFRAVMNPSSRRVHCRSSTHPSGRGPHEKRRAMREARCRDRWQSCIYTYLF